MQNRRLPPLAFILLLALGACNLPSGATPPPGLQGTAVVFTLTALQLVNPPQPAASPADTLTPPPLPPTETSLPSATPTPQAPLVLRDTLCWVGPGSYYEVVSALKKDTNVELLGRGSISGWWVVRNPIYNDPCWVRENDLLIDPAYDTTNLKIFNPPATSTHTPKPPTPTSTP